jgi:hypothetical protein
MEDAEAEDVQNASQITDPRFCMIPCQFFENDWELGAWGGSDFWSRADELVTRRKSGAGLNVKLTFPFPIAHFIYLEPIHKTVENGVIVYRG